MYYNIVSLRNRWAHSGILKGLQTIKQEVELSRYLESASNTLLELDNEYGLPEKTPDLVILSIVRLYKMVFDTEFSHDSNLTRIMSNNLRMDEHKINVQDVIDITMNNDMINITHGDYIMQEQLEFEIRTDIVLEYLKKNN